MKKLYILTLITSLFCATNFVSAQNCNPPSNVEIQQDVGSYIKLTWAPSVTFQNFRIQVRSLSSSVLLSDTLSPSSTEYLINFSNFSQNITIGIMGQCGPDSYSREIEFKIATVESVIKSNKPCSGFGDLIIDEKEGIMYDYDCFCDVVDELEEYYDCIDTEDEECDNKSENCDNPWDNILSTCPNKFEFFSGLYSSFLSGIYETNELHNILCFQECTKSSCGKGELSGIGQANIKIAPSNTLLNLLNNPVRNEIKLATNFKQAESGKLTLFDTKGQTIRIIGNNIHFEAGSHQLPFDVSTLESGIYLLVIELKSQNVLFKVVKS